MSAVLASASSLPSSPFPSYLLDDSAEGGYPTELFDDTQLAQHADYVCAICTSVCRHVVSCPTACAVLLCSACVDRWFAQGKCECPTCRTPLAREACVSNKYVDKQIRGMAVHCPNECGKAGLVIGVDERSIKEHLSQLCTHRSVRCPRGCGVAVRLIELAEHDEQCACNTVLCPNGCVEYKGAFLCGHMTGLASVPTARQKHLIPHHVDTDCPNTQLACLQCSVPVRRCEWEAHGRSDAHQLKTAQETIQLLARAVEALTKKAYGDNSTEASELRCALDLATRSSASTPIASLAQAASQAPLTKAVAERACRCYAVIAANLPPSPLPFSAEPPQPPDFSASLTAGSLVGCHDTAKRWLKAEVKGASGGLVHVHYLGWDERWDEWIARDSWRIQPLHLFAAREVPSSSGVRTQLTRL